MDDREVGRALGLSGKVAVVAGGGGAKNGIGRATALLYAKLGAKTVILDIDKEAAEETARLVSSAGEPASVWPLDVTKEEQIKTVLAEIIEKYGGIDIWAHVAGGHKGATLIEDIPPAVWRANLELNLTGVFLCARAVLPVMKRQRQGKIVLVSSWAGRKIGSTSGADYAAAKAGVVTFTKQLAFEAGPFNINVNAIAPGPTHEPDAKRDRQDGRLSKSPIQRFAAPEDQARVIVFLSSVWAEIITGITVDVDGGMNFGWMDYATYLSKHAHPVTVK